MGILDLINQSKNKENYTKREYNKRECNENFFKTLDNEKSAYWAGFILSDGNLTKYIVRTELSIKDLDHLKKFQNDMESTHPIEITKRLNKSTNKEYEFCAIQFTRKKLVEDLIKHGITKDKSKYCEIPKSIPDNIIHHFLRGVLMEMVVFI